ncbi:MAG: TatD family hydrolase, partial [Ilumatobacteraceae bacterium]
PGPSDAGPGNDSPAGLLPLRWVDSHCHVHDARIPDGTDAAVAVAADAGVTTLITVGCDRETSQAAIDAAAAHRGVHATVGLHPHDAVNGVETILDLLDTPGIVAVGEAGLDYYYDHSPREVQQRAFEEQIQLANDRDLPLVIHTRDAWDDTFDVLASVGVPTRTIFHCFTGGPDEAGRALDIGALLSFSGIVTFKGAPEVQAAAILCPLDRLLVETDSPYLAPIPHRGKPNRPAWVPHVGQFIADLRDRPVDGIARATSANADEVFALPSH